MDQGYVPVVDVLGKKANNNLNNNNVFKEPKLFVLKIEPFDSSFQLKLKLKNIEIWACDYNRFKEKLEDPADASDTPSLSSKQKGSKGTGDKTHSSLDFRRKNAQIF